MPLLRRPSVIAFLIFAASLAAILAISNLRGLAAAEPEPMVNARAPDFAGIERWLNSGPLAMKDLQGKVVLVDFWTTSCVNCLRTLPYVAGWYARYRDKGFVVIGVHTPEFPFERETERVQKTMERFGIAYPVAQDNDYATWKAYANRYWPAQYLIDRHGRIVRQHFGEGDYEEMEHAIRRLLEAG